MKPLRKMSLLLVLLLGSAVVSADEHDGECHLPVCEPGTVLVIGDDKNECPSAWCAPAPGGSGSTSGPLPSSLEQCCSTKREECEYNGTPSGMCATVYQMCLASQQCTIN